MSNTNQTHENSDFFNATYAATLEATLQNVITERDVLKKNNDKLLKYIEKQASIIEKIERQFGDQVRAFIIPLKQELGPFEMILSQISSDKSDKPPPIPEKLDTRLINSLVDEKSSALFSDDFMDIASGLFNVNDFNFNTPTESTKTTTKAERRKTSVMSSSSITSNSGFNPSILSIGNQQLAGTRTGRLNSVEENASPVNSTSDAGSVSYPPSQSSTANHSENVNISANKNSTQQKSLYKEDDPPLKQLEIPGPKQRTSSLGFTYQDKDMKQISSNPNSPAIESSALQSPNSQEHLSIAQKKKLQPLYENQRAAVQKSLPGLQIANEIRRDSAASEDSNEVIAHSHPSLLDILNESRATSSPSSNKKVRLAQREHLLTHLEKYTVEIVGCPIRKNEKMKEIVAFIIAVKETNTNQIKWKVEKRYSDFLDLDQKFKNSANRGLIGKLAKLPEKNLFNSHSPSKSDERKIALEHYLQKAITVLIDKKDLVEFITSDFVNEEAQTAVPVKKKLTSVKEGFLFKKGKNLGGWKTRYFILRHGLLDYFESKDRDFLGTIKLKYCLVDALVSTEDADERHGFVITEYKKGILSIENLPPNKPPPDNKIIARHILCAETDQERDEWVAFMTAHMNKARAISGRTLSKESINTKQTESVPNLASKDSLNMLQSESKLIIPIVKDVHSAFQSVHASNESVHSNVNSPASKAQVSVSTESFNQQNIDAQGGRESFSNIQKAPLPTAQHPASGLMNGTANNHDQCNGIKGFLDENERILSKPAPPALTDEHKRPEVPLISPTSTTKRNKDESLVKSLAMNMFGKKKQQNSADPTRRIFGIPLEQVVAISKIKEDYELPAVVYRCIEYLEAKQAIKEEGIYRLSGSTATIQQLKERFNQELDFDILSSPEYYDVHAVAGVFKLFFRELPTSILTHSLQPEFMRVTDLLERNEKITELSRLVSLLPLENYTVLRALVAHLIRVVQNCSINKMTVRNIGIVFSPTLNIPAGLLTLMLSEYGIIFCGESFEENGLHKPDDSVNSQQNLAHHSLAQTSSDMNINQEQRKYLQQQEHRNQNTLSATKNTPSDLVNSNSTENGAIVINAPPRKHSSLIGGKKLANTRNGNRNSAQYEDSVPESLRVLETGIHKLNLVDEDHTSEAVADFYSEFPSEDRIDQSSSIQSNQKYKPKPNEMSYIQQENLVEEDDEEEDAGFAQDNEDDEESDDEDEVVVIE